MSKFKIGDRVKFHMEGCPECDGTGTVCNGPYEVTDTDYWINWDKGGNIQYSPWWYLTLIESTTNEALPPSFKIDVQAYATENNISLEQAHNEIQPWLFGRGFVWASWISGYPKDVMYKFAPALLCSLAEITYCGDIYSLEAQSTKEQIFLSRNVSVSLSVKEEETVEILGKKYLKSDVENAMKKVKEKE